MVTNREKKYSQSIERIEEIVEQLENGELSIDHILENVQEANALISHCNKLLRQVEQELEKETESEDETVN